MKCENCGNELIGATIICRVCSHNNAMLRVSAWRSRRSGHIREASTQRTSEIPAIQKPETRVEARTEARTETRTDPPSGYLRFPTQAQAIQRKAAAVKPVIEAEPELSEYPPWRAQVKEKVRQARERRLSQHSLGEDDQDEADLDQNPIVAAALKRIRKASETAAITTAPRTVRHGSRAAVLAEEIDSILAPDLKPEPRAERLEAQPLKTPAARPAAMPATKPALQRAVRPAIPQIPGKPAVNKVETKAFTPRPPVELRVQPEVKRPNSELRVKPEIKRPNAERLVQPEIKRQSPDSWPQPEAKGPQVSEPGTKLEAEGKMVIPLPRTPSPSTQMEEAKPQEVKSGPLPFVNVPSKRIDTQIIEIPFVISELEDVGPKPATIWVRTLAGGCDFEIIAMSFLPTFAAYATLDTSLGEESLFIMFVLLAAISFVYQTVTLLIAGRTFGMAVLNMRLVDAKDERLPVTYRQKFLRAWGATIAFLFPPINLMVMRLNRTSQSFPDIVSGTFPIEE